jgi:hypothetical protein
MEKSIAKTIRLVLELTIDLLGPLHSYRHSVGHPATLWLALLLSMNFNDLTK